MAVKIQIEDHLGEVYYPKTSDDLVLLEDEMHSLRDYVNSVPGRNLLINGGFQVWQRGTTFPKVGTGTTWFDINSSGSYTADRWYVTKSSGTSITVTKDTNYGAVITSTGDGIARFRYFADADDFAFLDGKTVTLTIAFENTVSKKTYVVTSQTLVDEEFTAGTIHYMKLELGEIATPYVPEDYGTELLKCARYYWRPQATVLTYPYGSVTNYLYMDHHFAVPMRATPTVTIFEPGLYTGGDPGGYKYGDEGWGASPYMWRMGQTERTGYFQAKNVTASNFSIRRAQYNSGNALVADSIYHFHYEADAEIDPGSV